MSYKYWLFFGSLALGAAQTVACSSEFSSCEARRNCPAGGASGTAGAAGSDTDGGEAGAHEGGSAGLDAHAGQAGTVDDADNAGAGGMAGDSDAATGLEIAQPTLTTGKTYVPFEAKLSASGAAHYTWSITSGTLPAGLTLQAAQTAHATIDGTPTEAGQFPITLRVSDGAIAKSVDVTLAVTHSALFLSDRRLAGVNELFLADIGGSTSAPVQLNASLPAGGSVTSYAWSPDGSKVLYLATQATGGAAELWVTTLAKPGVAQRVSAVGVTVSQMVWLGQGNIAAYILSIGDAYLADLSNSTPGTSKLVVQGPGTPSALATSPNGTSLTVGTSDYDSSGHVTVSTVTYVTWAAGTPKSVKTYGPALAQAFLSFSFDGRFGVNTNGWWDLSLASPSFTGFGNKPGDSVSLSPKAQAIIFTDANPYPKLSLGIFEDSTLKLTALAQGNVCSFLAEPWSPDGMNTTFRCNSDIRGINRVLTAAAGTDFSLLPTDFLANAFTDTLSVGWSPNSQWIALRADRDVDAQFDLQLIRWSAPGVAYKPHANTTASGVTTWTFAPNSQSVAFVGSIAPQGNAGLYLTRLPASGAPPTAALVSVPANAVVQPDVNWLPGSRVITYRAMVSGAAQLFAIPVAADGTAGNVVSISGVSGRGVTSYQLAPTR